MSRQFHINAFVRLMFLLTLSDARVPQKEKERSTRIVHGFDCMPEEYPFLVSIQNRNYRHFCGGSLMNERYVLTAAHCCDVTDKMFVFAGLSSLRRTYVQKAKVKSMRKHPDYSFHPMKNDICVLELKTPIWETDTIKYVQLADGDMWEVSRFSDCIEALVPGFGYRGQKFLNGSKMEPKREFPTDLQCVTLRILKKEVCEYAISSVDESLFCAVDDSVQGRDPCQGDSGGPFICDEVQYGVVSSGFGCGLIGYPSLYARVDIHEEFLTVPEFGDKLRSGCNCLLSIKPIVFCLTFSVIYIF